MMKTEKLNVICFAGAASCSQFCMQELQDRLGGILLDFNYRLYLDSKRGRMTCHEFLIHWIHENVNQNRIVLCLGIDSLAAKKIFREAYPDKYISLNVWEVHHEENKELQIMKERSLRLLLEGILEDGKMAISWQVKASEKFVKKTPLSIAISHLRKKDFSIDKFLQDLTQDLLSNNRTTCSNSIKCEEGFDPVKRTHSINKIVELVS